MAYSIVELNKVASRKTGEIEAQCKLADGIESLQNGQIVYIDAAKDEIVLEKNENCVDAMYLHFSNPRRYEDGKTGMENFIYTKSEKYLPRLYKLTAGDIFTTDFNITNHEGRLVEITAGNMPYGTLPNGKAGKTYRVVR
jgi:hypothetical protein